MCYPWAFGGVPPIDKLIHFDIIENENQIDRILQRRGIKLEGQYASNTDNHHTWKRHVVNHVFACELSSAEFIVFADADCWIRYQPDRTNWIERGIYILKENKDVFIVSPNDGGHERKTQRMSQQMFLVRRSMFAHANLNQPGWDGNTNIPGGPMPEYWGMLEGRMELHCQNKNTYRYVLGPEYRYWHHNRKNSKGNFETNYGKY
jgi:hypothetical protein